MQCAGGGVHSFLRTQGVLLSFAGEQFLLFFIFNLYCDDV